jgi:hypothetical protein
MASSIQTFIVTKNRSDNDKNNNIRENVLLILHDPPATFMSDPVHGDMWKTMSSKWKTFLSTLCNEKYNNIQVKRLGGRGNNHDFIINFLDNNISVKTIHKAEFKHNSNSIENLPQYFNAPEKKRYIEKSYAEYFYDNYIDRICALSDTLIKPSKKQYMKYIYGSVYSKDKFFVRLKEIEHTIQSEKKSIVCESIKTYLELYSSTLNINMLTDDIKRTQRGKIFILWDCKNFKSDAFLDNEFEIENIVKIKNNNVIVVKSKHGTIHNLLLRWKNHLGILYPAWQISLERLVECVQSQS